MCYFVTFQTDILLDLNWELFFGHLTPSLRPYLIAYLGAAHPRSLRVHLYSFGHELALFTLRLRLSSTIAIGEVHGNGNGRFAVLPPLKITRVISIGNRVVKLL